MSLAQIKNTGDLEATDFSEISYAGKGDGSSVYIDTGITANTINNFEITFKWYFQSTNILFGVVGNNTRYYFGESVGVARIGLGNNSSAVILTPYLIDGNIYKLKIIQTSPLVFNIILLDVNNGDLYNTNYTSTSIASANCWIYAYNSIAPYKTQKTIYSFTINSETWYINNGSGNTITGSLGTVLTVNGTLTNFWQQSDIWNEDANLKMYNTGMVKCNEFDEVATTYAGKGDGSSVYIDTGIPANTIDNFEIVFKYNNAIIAIYDGIFGAVRDSSDYFWLRQSATAMNFYLGYTTVFWSLFSYMIEDNIYRFNLVNNGSNSFTVILFNITLNSQVYSETKTITGIIPSLNLAIYRRNVTTLNPYYTIRTIYSFQINDETWYLNQGTGTSITGDKGTVLTVSGTTTSFWQPSEIWNDPAQMKLLENELDIKNEIVEI